MKTRLLALASLLLAGGCFTVHHSPPPVAPLTPLGEGRDCRVALSGFEATVTTYLPVRTYSTVWAEGPGWYDRRGHWRGGGAYPTTATSTTYIPQVQEDTSFVRRAADALEESGFLVVATNADYVVDVTFAGPAVSNGDRFAEFVWVVCSLLSADYQAETWTARLKVREARTGKVVALTDFTERCTVAVWGPIPVFSPLAADATEDAAMQSWALTALTDRAMASATAFLSTRLPPTAP